LAGEDNQSYRYKELSESCPKRAAFLRYGGLWFRSLNYTAMKAATINIHCGPFSSEWTDAEDEQASGQTR